MENPNLVITYKSKLYDLTKFQHKHPGGINTLKGLNNSDIKQRFEKAPAHSQAAMYLMKEYEIANIRDTNSKRNLTNGIENGQKNGVKNGSISSRDLNSNTLHQKTDESMEVSIINPNR